MDKILQFFTENDIWYDTDAIQLVDHLPNRGYGYGIIAKTHIPIGTVVCKIPKSSILSIRNSGISDIIEEHSLFGPLGLALALMFEQALGEKSPWYLYLTSIPKKEELPMFHIDKIPKGTSLETLVQNYLTYLKDDYDEHIEPLLQCKELAQYKSRLTFDDYKNAMSLITSRAFDVDAYHGDALVPLADIFNHRSDHEHVHFVSVGDVCEQCGAVDCDCFEEDTMSTDEESVTSQMTEEEDSPDIMTMTVVHECKAGKEVYNTFGHHSNAIMLNRYGFCQVKNPHNELHIQLNQLEKCLGPNVTSTAAYWNSHRREIIEYLIKQSNSDDSIDDEEVPEEITFIVDVDGLPELELILFLLCMAKNNKPWTNMKRVFDSFIQSYPTFEEQLSHNDFIRKSFQNLYQYLNSEFNESLRKRVENLSKYQGIEFFMQKLAISEQLIIQKAWNRVK